MLSQHLMSKTHWEIENWMARWFCDNIQICGKNGGWGAFLDFFAETLFSSSHVTSCDWKVTNDRSLHKLGLIRWKVCSWKSKRNLLGWMSAQTWCSIRLKTCLWSGLASVCHFDRCETVEENLLSYIVPFVILSASGIDQQSDVCKDISRHWSDRRSG